MKWLPFYFIFLTHWCYGQTSSDTLWGPHSFRSGISLQAGVGFWSQPNLNDALLQNSLPATVGVGLNSGFGYVCQWNKTRAHIQFLMISNRNTGGGENLLQLLAGGGLDLEYAVVRKKGYSLSPVMGVGFLGGTLNIRQHATSQPLSSAFTQRNTTVLFNQQGYVQAGVNVGFAYLPSIRSHFFQLGMGYRMGFLNTDWSTDPLTEVLTDSTTDALQQLYVSLKINYMRRVR